MSSGIKPALAVSVALNVLLAGMLLGDLSHRYIAPPPASFDVASQLSRLPPQKRSLYDTVMGAAKRKMDAERAEIDNEKKLALGILKAEPFNAEAYLKQVQRINDLHVQMKQHVAQAVAELAKQMTQQERDIVAEIVSHPPFAGPPGGYKQDTPAAAGP
jgi:uncharacterized membrane protein